MTTSLDILINSEPGTAACKIQESSVLLCRPSYSRHKKEDVIKIIGSSEPSLGAVSFNPALTGQIEVKPASIEMNYKSKEKFNFNGYLYFNIIGNLPNAITAEIGKDSYTQIKVSKSTDKATTYDIPCTTNEIEKAKGSVVNITCQTVFSFTEEISIVRDEEGKSGYVKIIMEEEGEIDLSQTDKPTSENKENPSPSESYSSYYNIFELFYVMLFILL